MRWKVLLTIWTIWIGVIISLFIKNNNIPFWFDQNFYQHLVNLIEIWRNYQNLPVYLQYHEPFSGIFFWTLLKGTNIDSNIFFSWWYLCIYAAIWGAMFLFWKKKKYYTLGSYIGFSLCFFSVFYYSSFWWWLGKQMFATFFLILLFRYYKNVFLTVLFWVVIISLHRLTWVVWILFLGIIFLQSKEISLKKGIFLAIGAWIVSYLIAKTTSYQLLPFFSLDIKKYIGFTGSYGTGFDWLEAFFKTLPLIILFTLSIYQNRRYNKNILKNPLFILTIIIGIILALRGIAHTRLWPFLYTLLLGMIVQIAWIKWVINTKILFWVMLINIFFWWIWLENRKETFVDKEELNIIQEIATSIPDDVSLVTTTWAYMWWIMRYTEKEVYSPQYGIWTSIWKWEERKSMLKNKEGFCDALSELPWVVFVYKGRKEFYSVDRGNPCLVQTMVWKNGSQLLRYEKR